MHIYISGPMRGLPDNNYPAFNQAAKALREQGCTVTNPADSGTPERNANWTQKDWMKHAVFQLSQCDAIAMLPGWENSPGATFELYVATQIGMVVLFDQTCFKASPPLRTT